jgi:methionyl-tRNA synthetase
MQRTLITAALPYANGYIHLGHCAGAYLPADMYARYLRLRGHPTLFVCGSDEHGAPITIAAEQEGISPRELIERYHRANAEAFARLGISFDIYGRTSDPHLRRCSRLLPGAAAQGLPCRARGGAVLRPRGADLPARSLRGGYLPELRV